MIERTIAPLRVFLLATLVLIGLSCQAVPRKETTYVRLDDPRVRRIEQIFGLTPPYSIRSWSMDDCGSIDAVLVGANRDSLAIYWNETMVVLQDSSKAPPLLHLGRSSKVPLAVASAEESALVDALHISAVEVFGSERLRALDTLLADSRPGGEWAVIQVLDEPKQKALKAHLFAQSIQRRRDAPRSF